MPKGRGAKRHLRPRPSAIRPNSVTVPEGDDERFAALRSGAANVAGVRFQIVTTAWVLLAGRSGTVQGLEVVRVTPEGFEDIDCVLESGRKLLIQVKERSVSSGNLSTTELVDAIVHAAPSMAEGRDFAFATNVNIARGVPFTGTATTLGELLRREPEQEGRISRDELLEKFSGDPDGTPSAEWLLDHTFTIRLERSLAESCAEQISDEWELDLAVASMVLAEVMSDLTEIAALQRERTEGTALTRSQDDLDQIVRTVVASVDVTSLQEGVFAGVCEPADFSAVPPFDLRTFLEGVNVIPSYIGAGYDVPRPHELELILSGLNERRHVVVAGASGSGKSALIWRSARMIGESARVVRVTRVGTVEDVEVLCRHVLRQMPSEGRRVLVVCDDLGTDRMQHWPEARRRLAEMSGVFILTAVRRERLTPALTASGVVVDPRLAASDARAIYAGLREVGIELSMTCEEAVERARELLMEFVALSTRGVRHEDVLREQLSTMSGQQFALHRDVLRTICGAHLAGSSIPAASLSGSFDATDDALGEALRALRNEHLIMEEDGSWRGLHELRSTVIFDLLHEVSPPTRGATFARILRMLPSNARGGAARWACIRVARDTANRLVRLEAPELLSKIVNETAAIGEELAHQIATLPDTDDAVAFCASLLEAADRCDTTAYAYAVLPMLESTRPRDLDLEGLANICYGDKVDGLSTADLVPGIRPLLNRMPERESPAATVVASRLAPEKLAALMRVATPIDAIRIGEAAEGLVHLSIALVKSIYESRVQPLPIPAGVDRDLSGADQRAQLTATLAALGDLSGAECERAFGAPEIRIADAVGSDRFGCTVSLTFEDFEPPPDEASALARINTFRDTEMFVAEVRAFVRYEVEDLELSSYASRNEVPATVNAQAVVLGRRIFDACPDLDRLDLEMWNPRCEPAQGGRDSVKHLRAGVLRRRSQVSRNVAFQAAVAEALGAESWTIRLRQQSQLSQVLVGLLSDLPRRLAPYDHARRRRQWIEDVESAAESCAALPRRPIPSPWDLAEDGWLPAGEMDLMLREKDLPKEALGELCSTLKQVATCVETGQSMIPAGMRLARITLQLEQARSMGSPVYGGIGPALPEDLDRLCLQLSRVLTASGETEMRSAVRDLNWFQSTNLAIELLARRSAVADRDTLAPALNSVPGVRIHIVPDEDPIVPWRIYRLAIDVEIASWVPFVNTLRAWLSGDGAEAISTPLNCVCVHDGAVIAIGIHVLGSMSELFPIDEEACARVAELLGVPFREPVTRTELTPYFEATINESYRRVRIATRNGDWASEYPKSLEPLRAQLMTQYESDLVHLADVGDPVDSSSFRGLAVARLIEVSEAVDEQDGVAGLAEQLTDLDFARLPEPPDAEPALAYVLGVGMALAADGVPEDVAASVNELDPKGVG